MGGNPRYKGTAQRVMEIDQPDKQRTRVTREREDNPQKSPASPRSKGNARSKDIGLPTLQEARMQA